jgi:hypothetical protein
VKLMEDGGGVRGEASYEQVMCGQDEHTGEKDRVGPPRSSRWT